MDDGDPHGPSSSPGAMPQAWTDTNMDLEACVGEAIRAAWGPGITEPAVVG